MNNFGKTVRYKSEIKVLIYAGLMLLATSFIMQYPFHLTTYNQENDAWAYKLACDWLYAPDHFASLTRPFLFSFLIGLPRLLGFEYSEYFVAAMNGIFWFLTVWLLFRVVRAIYDKKMAFIGTLIFASCVSLHCFLFLVNTEVIYVFVLLSHVVCLHQYLKTQKDNWLYGAMWLLGASVAIRPTLTYFAFVLYFILVVIVVLKKLALKKFVLISLLLLSTIGLQMFNMYRCTHRYKISYIGDTAWYLYFSAYATKPLTIFSVALLFAKAPSVKFGNI